MTPKYKLHQNVFLMISDRPVMRQIAAITMFSKHNLYYVYNHESGFRKDLDSFWLKHDTEDKKLIVKRSYDIYESMDELKESIFGGQEC